MQTASGLSQTYECRRSLTGPALANPDAESVNITY